ncbi:MAG: lysozyme inhibitor LprI family protein [Pseudomonadota bacterium]
MGRTACAAVITGFLWMRLALSGSTRPIMRCGHPVRLAALLLVLPVPALAAPDPALVATLKRCVTEALPDMTDARGCIGDHFRLCQTAEERQHWEGALRCLREMGKAWDALLAQTWPPALDWARGTDADTARRSDPVPSAEDALRAAWPAWAAWRDAECTLHALSWPGDPLMQEMEQAVCWYELTTNRVIELHAMLRGPE